jgi:hypothetical protein
MLLLAGCATEKGIIDRDGYQLDTRHPAQAAYRDESASHSLYRR